MFLYSSCELIEYESVDNNSHNCGVFRICASHRLDFRPQVRQCRFLHGQQEAVLVCGGFRYDRLRDVGSDLCLSTWNGGGLGLRIYADGPRLHCRTTCHRLRADTAFLQDESGFHIRLSGGEAWRVLLSYRSLVLLHFQDVGGIRETVSRMHFPTADGIRPSRYSILGQCVDYHTGTSSIHIPGRGEGRYLD